MSRELLLYQVTATQHALLDYEANILYTTEKLQHTCDYAYIPGFDLNIACCMWQVRSSHSRPDPTSQHCEAVWRKLKSSSGNDEVVGGMQLHAA